MNKYLKEKKELALRPQKNIVLQISFIVLIGCLLFFVPKTRIFFWFVVMLLILRPALKALIDWIAIGVLFFVPELRVFSWVYFGISLLLGVLIYLMKEYLSCGWFYCIKTKFDTILLNLCLEFLMTKPTTLFLPIKRSLTENEFREQLKAGIDLNATDDNRHLTPLIFAIQLKNTSIVKSLINAGVDVNKRDNGGHGWTPLIWAVYYESADIVKVLIDAGAILDAREENVWHKKMGWTAVMMARAAGNKNIVYLLMKAGANINNKAADNFYLEHRASDGETVLNHLIKWIGHNRVYDQKKTNDISNAIKSAQLLIALGADLNIKDAECGESALWLSISNGVIELIQPLGTAGVNINEENEYGETPFSYAMRKKDYQMSKALKAVERSQQTWKAK